MKKFVLTLFSCIAFISNESQAISPTYWQWFGIMSYTRFKNINLLKKPLKSATKSLLQTSLLNLQKDDFDTDIIYFDEGSFFLINDMLVKKTEEEYNENKSIPATITQTTMSRQQALQAMEQATLQFINKDDTRPLADHIADFETLAQFLDKEKDKQALTLIGQLSQNKHNNSTTFWLSTLGQIDPETVPCHPELFNKSYFSLLCAVKHRCDQTS